MAVRYRPYKLQIREVPKTAFISVPYQLALTLREKFGEGILLQPELTDEGILYRVAAGQPREAQFPDWLQ
jgi:hypothetical protein